MNSSRIRLKNKNRNKNKSKSKYGIYRILELFKKKYLFKLHIS